MPPLIDTKSKNDGHEESKSIRPEEDEDDAPKKPKKKKKKNKKKEDPTESASKVGSDEELE